MTDVNDFRDPCYDDREPDESAWLDAEAAHDYELHCRRVHGGRHCDCPPVAADDLSFTEPPPF